MIKVVTKKASQWNNVFLYINSVQNVVICTQCDCDYRNKSVKPFKF